MTWLTKLSKVALFHFVDLVNALADSVILDHLVKQAYLVHLPHQAGVTTQPVS